MEEEEVLASPIPVASPSTVCTRCPVLEKKTIFRKRSVGSEDQRVNQKILINANSTSSNAKAITLHIAEF